MENSAYPVVTHVEHKGLMAKIEGEPHKWHAKAVFMPYIGPQYGIHVESNDVFDLARMWAHKVDILEQNHPAVFAEWQQAKV